MNSDKVSGVVLAAGRSTRLRPGDTPNSCFSSPERPWFGEPRRRLLAPGSFPVTVVLGLPSSSPGGPLRSSRLPADEPHHTQGQSTSVREVSLLLVRARAEHFFYPVISPCSRQRSWTSSSRPTKSSPEAVVVPRFEGRRGAPVLFPGLFFPASPPSSVTWLGVNCCPASGTGS